MRTLDRLFGGRSKSDDAGYAEAKLLASSADPAERKAVATRPDTRPELLYFLARDPALEVREAVATHPATPRHADLILALDESPGIRTLVATKVTRNLAAPGGEEAAHLWQVTVEVLEALMRDDLLAVRALVAEAARSAERFPKHVAFTLARDRQSEVAVPALDYRGGFADDELVAIVEGALDEKIVTAVARRTGIGGRVADAIVARDEPEGVQALLENRSATIPPQAMERILDRASDTPSWHAALVTRPEAAGDAAIRLAGIVRPELVDRLQSRPELGEATRNSIGFLLKQRLSSVRRTTATPQIIEPRTGTAGAAARRFDAANLSEDAIIEALGHDHDFVREALAVRARLPSVVVAKMLASKSAKGLTALAWRAGYGVRLALQLQLRAARLSPKVCLSPVGGRWPLTEQEMEWQIEFFRSLAPTA